MEKKIAENFNYQKILPRDFFEKNWSISENYGFYFLPKNREKNLTTEKFYFFINNFSQISFLWREIFSGNLEKFTDKKNYLFLADEFSRQNPPQKLLRAAKKNGDRKILSEEFENGKFRCAYFLERLDENFVVFYSGCGEKTKFFPAKKKLASKNFLQKKLRELEKSRVAKIDKKFFTFQNSIRSFDFKNKTEKIEKIVRDSFDPRALECEQKFTAPVLFCWENFYENYGESLKLFFLNSQKYFAPENCRVFFDEKNYEKTRVELVEKKIILHCDPQLPGSTKTRAIYDFAGNLQK